MQVRILFIRCLETAEGINKFLTVRFVPDQKMGDPVGNRKIAMPLHFQIVLAGVRRSRSAGADVDECHFFTATATIDDTRKQDRMHFCRVVAPHNQNITLIEVVITTGRFIHTIGRQKPSHG